ncbi:hypothetical protein QVD17_00155 [Tagetes erecta]|uniref:Uncharacterized protein n=1 Tax=Tagetes erecta TaxID=13708 RepID=A0AAD8P0D2_TARER|nr:hypothetical protein QVD17_00155 [Tagetes erecta]
MDPDNSVEHPEQQIQKPLKLHVYFYCDRNFGATTDVRRACRQIRSACKKKNVGEEQLRTSNYFIQHYLLIQISSSPNLAYRYFTFQFSNQSLCLIV